MYEYDRKVQKKE